jgi:integrase
MSGLKLYPPRPGKTPNWTIRGSYMRVRVDRSAGTPRRSAAELERKRIERAIERGEYPPKPALVGEPTFLTAAVAYMKAGGSRRHMRTLIRYFGEIALSDIDQAAIDTAATTLHPNVSAATRNGYVYTPVSAVLHHAGVAITVRRPKGYKGREKTLFLLPADAFAIIDAANVLDPEMGRLLTFLLYTGCRISEALALRWERVDLDQRLAYVETSKNDDPRSAKLTAELVTLLEPHSKPSGRVFRFHQGGHRNFIFLNAKVTACGLAPVKRPKAGERLMIQPYRFAWVTFHTFCHTWATWMRRYGGADLQGLVATGRWRDERSARRYTHAAAHEEWDRVDALPARGKSVESAGDLAKLKSDQNAG